MVIVVLGAIGVAVAVHAQLSGITHIKKIDVQHRPPKYTNALNILLIGSDRGSARTGVGGRAGCDCSDTLMIAHISPGRQSVTVISIPRDTVVPYYACAPTDGLPGQQADLYAEERINATLANGGPECVRETVEQQTGIFIDNVIELDFTGFEKVINDIGGVNVCLPFAIDNPVTPTEGSGLNLSAGEHHLNGKVALQFWRTRYNIANGSDIERIARDQYLMAQIVKGVLHNGLLHDPTKLYTVIGDVADAMTTDASDTELFHIALSLHDISPDHVQFITAPWATYPYDPNEVEFAQPQANALFWAIAHDSALPASVTTHRHGKAGHGRSPSTSPSPVTPVGTASPTVSPATSPAASPSASPAGQPESITPAQVNVEVLDGSSGPDRSTQAATALTSRGFNVFGTGAAPEMTHEKSVIEYASATDLPAAQLLAQQFTTIKLKLVPDLTPGTIDLILGSSFTRLAPPLPTAPDSIGSLSTTYGGITAGVRCRNSAFYGVYDSPQPGKTPACAC